MLHATYQKNIQFGILISLFLQHKLMKYIVTTLKSLFFKLATSNILKMHLKEHIFENYKILTVYLWTIITFDTVKNKF